MHDRLREKVSIIKMLKYCSHHFLESAFQCLSMHMFLGTNIDVFWKGMCVCVFCSASLKLTFEIFNIVFLEEIKCPVAYSVFLNIHQSGLQCTAVWLLHGRCHMKVLPSRHVLCTPYSHAPCHVTSCHVCRVLACLPLTCHLHFWQNDQDLLHATAVNTGVKWIPK